MKTAGIGVLGALLLVTLPASEAMSLAGAPGAILVTIGPGLALLTVAMWRAGVRGGRPPLYPDEPKIEQFSRGFLHALPWVVVTLTALWFALVVTSFSDPV